MTLDELANGEPFALLNMPEDEFSEVVNGAYSPGAVGEVWAFLQLLKVMFAARMGADVEDLDKAVKLVNFFIDSAKTEARPQVYLNADGKPGVCTLEPFRGDTLLQEIWPAIMGLLQELDRGKFYICERCGKFGSYSGARRPAVCSNACRQAVHYAKTKKSLTS